MRSNNFKTILFGVILISLFLLFNPVYAGAHGDGLNSFFLINNETTKQYHINSTSLTDFNLPQSTASETYLAGEGISFEIDTADLPFTEVIVKQSQFFWDFGDGIKGFGLKNSHSYKKTGSYILKIEVSAGGQPPQILQTTLINIVPDKNYQLPKSVISVNGYEGGGDPTKDFLESKFDMDFNFDGSKSTASSKISEYIWDFGDQTSGTGQKITHRYDTNPYAVFPVLRIKTEDGFIADSMVQIKEGDRAANPLAGESLQEKLFVGVFLLLIIYGGYFLVKSFKKT